MSVLIMICARVYACSRLCEYKYSYDSIDQDGNGKWKIKLKIIKQEYRCFHNLKVCKDVVTSDLLKILYFQARLTVPKSKLLESYFFRITRNNKGLNILCRRKSHFITAHSTIIMFNCIWVVYCNKTEGAHAVWILTHSVGLKSLNYFRQSNVVEYSQKQRKLDSIRMYMFSTRLWN